MTFRAPISILTALRDGFAFDPLSTDGLAFGLHGGVILDATGVPQAIAFSQTVLTDNATNYVARDAVGVVSASTGFFGDDVTPLAIVVTVNGAVHSVQDARQDAGWIGAALAALGVRVTALENPS